MDAPHLVIRYFQVLFAAGVLLAAGMGVAVVLEGETALVIPWGIEALIFLILFLGVTWHQRWAAIMAVVYFSLSVIGQFFLGRTAPFWWLSLLNLGIILAYWQVFRPDSVPS